MLMRKRIAALAAAAAPILALTVATTPAHADGYTEIKFANNLCLDVTGGNFSPGVQVQAWGCNSTDAQNWSIESADSTHFRIVASRSFGDKQALCLNNWEGGDVTGNHLKLYECNLSSPSDSLFNKTYYGGAVQLQPKVASANCLNTWGGLTQGAQIRLYRCGSMQEENVWSPTGAF
ncbi:ricin-type beta-trefoil lectin domain protein [Streptomyces sp. H10-C2]|uniref:RICIN domain-containing protein n=1 Tax=unclassified Streptomyces TaxID=2593676 RepID=UPI0024BBD506|nr:MULTISPECIES: RICIN domain-containing protein [unclassified Streptomyces]MDJ0347654.1 ricin-type beta-trefoil lectin domain protein [Streptomyces sp. PH10-H1]MDJ0375823.1 ricin-type beta-trefoil lectin domain protein [Streptomyces sp. H10-C2]